MSFVEFVEATFRIPAGRIAAKIWGSPTAKPVLAMHGWLDNSATFDRLIPYFENEFYVVAFDYLGHGLSDHRSEGSVYHLIDAIPDIRALVGTLGWKNYSILGHSLGGGIGSLYAGAFPKEVDKLVAIEALGPLTAEADELPKRVADYFLEYEKLAGKRLPVYPDEDAAVLARQRAGDLTESGTRCLVSRGLKTIEGGFTWRTDPRLRLPSPHRLTQAQTIAFLNRVECPTLLIRGSRGFVFEEKMWSERVNAISRLKTVNIDGGHHVHLDNPEPTAKVIREFLR